MVGQRGCRVSRPSDPLPAVPSRRGPPPAAPAGGSPRAPLVIPPRRIPMTRCGRQPELVPVERVTSTTSPPGSPPPCGLRRLSGPVNRKVLDESPACASFPPRISASEVQGPEGGRRHSPGRHHGHGDRGGDGDRPGGWAASVESRRSRFVQEQPMFHVKHQEQGVWFRHAAAPLLNHRSNDCDAVEQPAAPRTPEFIELDVSRETSPVTLG